jgi:hypothetical protein
MLTLGRGGFEDPAEDWGARGSAPRSEGLGKGEAGTKWLSGGGGRGETYFNCTIIINPEKIKNFYL